MILNRKKHEIEITWGILKNFFSILTVPKSTFKYNISKPQELENEVFEIISQRRETPQVNEESELDLQTYFFSCSINQIEEKNDNFEILFTEEYFQFFEFKSSQNSIKKVIKEAEKLYLKEMSESIQGYIRHFSYPNLKGTLETFGLLDQLWDETIIVKNHSNDEYTAILEKCKGKARSEAGTISGSLKDIKSQFLSEGTERTEEFFNLILKMK